jgi:hypothetical protein
MKVYLLTRSDVADWDEFVSCVVVASDEGEARLMHPDGADMVWINGSWHHRWFDKSGLLLHEQTSGGAAWVRPEDVVVQELGVPNETHEKKMLICSSFKAG